MNEFSHKSALISGIKDLCNYLNISQPSFYKWLKRGLPVENIDGRWYGHKGNIDDFLARITKPKKPCQVKSE